MLEQDYAKCIEKAIQTATRSDRSVEWSICQECVRRLASTPGVNMMLPRKPSESLNNPWFHTKLSDLQLSVESGCQLCKAILEPIAERLESYPVDDDNLPSYDALPPAIREEATAGPLKQRLLALQQYEKRGSKLRSLLDRKSPQPAVLQISLRLSRIDELLYVNPCALYMLGAGSEARQCRLARASPFGDRELFPVCHDDESAPYLLNRPANLDVFSSSAIAAAKRWLERCKSHCIECSQVDDDLEYPSRLIDVSRISKDLDITLVSTDGLRLGEYVALSYCWGPVPQPQKTTIGNVQQRHSGFRSSILPQTLVDAIAVTRALGFRYVWIDSVCILQDDSADKKKEIRKMKSIFEGASVTIVAASAALSTDGFLQKRVNPLSDPIGHLPFWTPDGVLGHCYLDKTRYDYSKKDPVHERAWTMEEWILSKRRLIYSQQELQWKCRSFRDHDGGVDQRIAGLPAELNLFKHTLGSKKSNVDSLLEADWQRDWPAVISQYTKRTLTDPRDRLIAIDGLVQRLCKSLSLNYVAGLFEEDALLGLCWRCPAQKVRNIIPSGIEFCPTWSWGKLASEVWIENNLHYSYEMTKSKVTEIKRLYEVAGRRSNCHLTVQGPLLSLYVVAFQIDFNQDTQSDHRTARLTIVENPDSFRDVRGYIFPDSREIYDTPGSQMSIFPLRYSPHHIDGLVVTEEEPSHFRRLAYLHLFDQPPDDGWNPERLFDSAAYLYQLCMTSQVSRISLI